MSDPMFDRGVIEGMELILIAAQSATRDNRIPTLRGYVAGNAYPGSLNNPFSTGMLRGIALACAMTIDRDMQTIQLRREV